MFSTQNLSHISAIRGMGQYRKILRIAEYVVKGDCKISYANLTVKHIIRGKYFILSYDFYDFVSEIITLLAIQHHKSLTCDGANMAEQS